MKIAERQKIFKKLLHWYDHHGRDLPWRWHPRQGVISCQVDPYSVWLSEVMLQQTTVAMASERFIEFQRRWPTIEHLAHAADEEVMAAWAGLGYYARARNLLKCAREVIEKFNGEFPQDVEDLITLPGIGPYTAAAISSIAFDRPTAAVDGNIERVLSRLFAVSEPFPKAKSVINRRARELCPHKRAGDWNQALMDLGAMVCKPRNPKCGECPIVQECQACQQGIQQSLPKKSKRRRRLSQRGILYVGRRRSDKAWLLEQRPRHGLLGGMWGWPGSDWDGNSTLPPPCEGDWRSVGEVSHSLTHLDLQLSVQIALLAPSATPTRGFFVPTDQFCPSRLPTLMRKTHRMADKAIAKL